jgi:uncharacterized protein (DUF2062 family)
MQFRLPRVRNPKLPRITRFYYHRILPRRDDPQAVAWSVALGVFIGIFPTLGVAVALTVAACELFKLPKLPGVLSSFIAIPPTIFPFFYPLGYAVGRFLLQPGKTEVDLLALFRTINFSNMFDVLQTLIQRAGAHFVAFLFGMVIVAAVFAALFFFLTLAVMRVKRSRLLRSRKARSELGNLPEKTVLDMF